MAKETNNNKLGDSISSQNAKIGSIVDDAVQKALKNVPSEEKSRGTEEKSSEDKTVVHELGKQVFEASIDWAKLEDWRDENGMPVKSFIDVYKALGLIVPMQKWKDATGLPIIPQMQVGCTFATYNQLKALIEGDWENWPIELVGNGNVQWKDGWEHKARSHPHSVKAYVRNSIKYDADQIGPFIADHKTAATDDNKVWFYAREKTKEEEGGKSDEKD
jgi:hypothetical protein